MVPASSPAVWLMFEESLVHMADFLSQQCCLYTVLIFTHKRREAVCITFGTSASLRGTIYELYAFRSHIAATHQNCVQCVTVSRASKRYVQKSCKITGNGSNDVLIAWSFHSGEVRNNQITWQTPASMVGLEKFVFLFFRKYWDLWQLMWPFKNSRWPPWKKGNKFPMLNLTP